MSNVKCATAWALKHAGLPQPEPAFGQIWYTGQRETKIVICGPVDFQGDYPNVPDHHVAIYSGEKEDWAFAPTVSDIIPLIGNNALIKFRKDETGQIFECNIEEGDGIERLLGYHETNPAEAAAMAWLRLNENDQYASDWLDSVTNETPSKTFVKPGAPGE